MNSDARVLALARRLGVRHRALACRLTCLVGSEDAGAMLSALYEAEAVLQLKADPWRTEARDPHTGEWVGDGAVTHDEAAKAAGFAHVDEAKAELRLLASFPQYRDMDYQTLLETKDRVAQQLARAKQNGRTGEDLEKWQRRYDALEKIKEARQKAAEVQRNQQAHAESQRTGKLTLSREELARIIANRGDVYVDAGRRRPFDYAPEYFRTSDLTGAQIRHYVRLPNGQIAHPDELVDAQKRGRVIVSEFLPRPANERRFRSELLPEKTRQALGP